MYSLYGPQNLLRTALNQIIELSERGVARPKMEKKVIWPAKNTGVCFESTVQYDVPNNKKQKIALGTLNKRSKPDNPTVLVQNCMYIGFQESENYRRHLIAFENIKSKSYSELVFESLEPNGRRTKVLGVRIPYHDDCRDTGSDSIWVIGGRDETQKTFSKTEKLGILTPARLKNIANKILTIDEQIKQKYTPQYDSEPLDNYF